jgi:vacuolar protein sorting-associated protein 11
VGTNLHAYGKTFLEEWPEETTHLFIAYYTGKYIPSKPEQPITSASPPPSISGALSSFRDAADITKYVHYLPYMSDKAKSSPPSSASNVQVSTTKSIPPVASEPNTYIPQYQPPRPRAAFSIFVDFPSCFVRFLEAMMEDEGFALQEKRDVDDICTALFEAYLREARNGKEERAMWEEKAKFLLTDQKVLHFDSTLTKVPVDTALLLSHLASFDEGTRIARERASLQIDIFRSYTTKRNTRAAIDSLHEYGPNEPDLYILALVYFCSDPKIMRDAGDELVAVLKKIEDDKLLTPLQIVQALSGTGVAHLGVVKAFLTDTIEKERRDIENVSLYLIMLTLES